MDKKILTYKELQKIRAGENDDALVSLNNYFPTAIFCKYEKLDMLPWSGNHILIRESIAEKLKKAAFNLQKIDKTLQFKVVYGYRHPTIQKKYFLKQKKLLSLKYSKLNNKELINLTHNFVASPDVAGHPCGAAIDLTIIKNGKPLAMGTKIADFNNPEAIKTFYKKLTETQKLNRLMLRKLIMDQGFAPFNGEWWHFSYGDKEWAFYYKQKSSLYSSLSLTKKEIYNIINKNKIKSGV
ncbi:MAG: D-alanyl-D-alanine carboxypeptidase family protein [Candidatus Pacebacteria bacterium]|nr:D-alanyl-D-alanine carboxypeptidase family protein [Candidatus Paceibacterota bacterium]